MKLLEMTTRDYANLSPRYLFWPVGTVEAHDRGPLGTDVIAPEKIASDLCGEFGAVLLPTLPFGLVNSLSGYPGGMWMSAETYRYLVVELLESLASSGAEGVIVFNGHGGNTDVLTGALSEVWKASGMRTALVDWWVAGEEIAGEIFGSSAGHGGSDELSVVHAAMPGFGPEWKGTGSWLSLPGVRAWPSPASSIRYSGGPATPFTTDRAEEYYRRLLDRLLTIVGGILDGWEEFERGRG